MADVKPEDSPRNPKAGVIQELVHSETFGEYLVPAAEDAPQGVFPDPLPGAEVPVEVVPEPEVVARAEGKDAVIPAHEHTPSEAGRMLQKAPHHEHVEPVLVKPKGELTASARTGAQRPATPRSQKQKDGK